MKETNSLWMRFQHEKLKEAREARGLTIREITELIGLKNHQTFSKYENGKSNPPAEVIFRLMKVLNFPHEYFFEESITSDINQPVFFRSKANTTKKLKRIHEIRVEWLMRIFNTLDTIVDFPESNLPKIDSTRGSIFQPTDKEEIEQIALSLREHWGLNNGPITDLTHLLEKNGIVVSIINSDEYNIDACSKWIGNKLFILVGNDKSAPSRIKFTLAHEVGHYMLHKNLRKEDFNKKDIYKRIEEEANHFASSFLLPADIFSHELIANTLDYYLFLKKRWQVSMQAMIYRSKELNLINEYQSSYLWRQIAKKGWRKQEPYDEVLKEELPSLLKEAFDLIVSHNVRTKEELLKEIGLNSSDIENISSLAPGYFNESKKKSNIISFKKK